MHRSWSRAAVAAGEDKPTPRAVSERLAKLRRNVNIRSGGEGFTIAHKYGRPTSDSQPNSNSGTPTKRKRKAKTQIPGSADGELDDDDDVIPTTENGDPIGTAKHPRSKKPNAGTKSVQAQPKIKKENGDGAGQSYPFSPAPSNEAVTTPATTTAAASGIESSQNSTPKKRKITTASQVVTPPSLISELAEEDFFPEDNPIGDLRFELGIDDII